MAAIEGALANTSEAKQRSPKLPFYRVLWVQVLLAMVAAVVLGYLRPERAVAMKPLGDAFIRLITMIISLIIFCTVVTGIAGMENLKKVGRIGGMALLYFEIVSTFALLIGLVSRVRLTPWTRAGRRANERHRRPPLAPVAPHQPRPARDAAHALERGGVARGQGRTHEGARAEKSDPANGLVQLGS